MGVTETVYYSEVKKEQIIKLSSTMIHLKILKLWPLQEPQMSSTRKSEAD